MILKKIFVLLVIFVTMYISISTQGQTYQFPKSPCPNIFQYSRKADKNIGILTINNLKYGKTRVQVELSQPVYMELKNPGGLSSNVNEDKISEYIKAGIPFTLRVDFPHENVIPDVTSIKINDFRICSGISHNAPNTNMNFEYILNVFPPETNSIQKSVSGFNNPLQTTTPNFMQVNHPSFVMQPRPQNIFLDRYRPTESYGSSNSPPPTFVVTEASTPTGYEAQKTIYTSPIELNITTGAPFNINVRIPEPSSSALTTNEAPSNNDATYDYINSICGEENPDVSVTKLNIGGTAINKSRFPWIVAVFIRNDNDEEENEFDFQCGGSLIFTRTVVSAAHCFYKGSQAIEPKDILISLGLHNLSERLDANNVDVKNIIFHPDYKPFQIHFDADVAIVGLQASVTFTLAVKPICMWQGIKDPREIVGMTGFIVGWGSDSRRKTTIVPTLVNAFVVEETTCIRSNIKYINMTSNRTLCAGNSDGSGPCMGDSGNGLMTRNHNKWMLRETVSAAKGTPVGRCLLDSYTIYSDIAMFIEWIQSNMLL